jgi:hypothetical protein
MAVHHRQARIQEANYAAGIVIGAQIDSFADVVALAGEVDDRPHNGSFVDFSDRKPVQESS